MKVKRSGTFTLALNVDREWMKQVVDVCSTLMRQRSQRLPMTVIVLNNLNLGKKERKVAKLFFKLAVKGIIVTFTRKLVLNSCVEYDYWYEEDVDHGLDDALKTANGILDFGANDGHKVG